MDNNHSTTTVLEAKSYPADAAGHLMIDNIPVVSPDWTIKQTEELLLKKIKKYETISYIYAVNKNGKLAGVISIKDILKQKKFTLISQVMTKDLVVAHPHTDRERVAYLALKHNIKAVPIIDKQDCFLGVIPADAIMRILDSEAVENLLRLGGVSYGSTFDNIFTLSLFKSLKHRLPWLILGLGGGILASKIVHSFEDVLVQNIILAAFIPLIVYMADAVGTQMESFIIRDLAVDPKLKFLKYFFRHFIIVFFVALICSSLLYIGTILFYDENQISLVLALALFFAIISAIFTGLVIPFIFSRFKFDPANASGPVATIIQDILAIVVYFTVANLLL